jgi:hypothetical protein
MSNVNAVTTYIDKGMHRLVADASGWKLEKLYAGNIWQPIFRFGSPSMQPLLSNHELEIRVNELADFNSNLSKLVENLKVLDSLLNENISIEPFTNELKACLTKDQN